MPAITTNNESAKSPGSNGRVIIFGGYGTFGRIVAQELAQRGIALTIAGRSVEKARSLASELGESHRGVGANVCDADACCAAIAGHVVAVNCAGPFNQLGTALLDACCSGGCHYVDIADDRAYCRAVRERNDPFAQRNLVAIYGCSSLPAISLAAAINAGKHRGDIAASARITLFIGNNNPKGAGAVRSASALVGRKIVAPQAALRGFRDRERVPLPTPFGPRTVLNFESPDYDLFPARLKINDVRVKVGFELSLANWAFNTFATLLPVAGRSALPLLGQVGGLMRGFGSSGGVVMSELFWPDGETHRTAVVAKQQGQRMAALPAVYVALRLCHDDAVEHAGARTCVDILGADELLELLVVDGYDVFTV